MTFTLSVLPAGRNKILGEKLLTTRLPSPQPLYSLKLTIFIKELLQSLIIHVLSEVLDVNIGELFGFGTHFCFPLLPGLETAHKPTKNNGDRNVTDTEMQYRLRPTAADQP